MPNAIRRGWAARAQAEAELYAAMIEPEAEPACVGRTYEFVDYKMPPSRQRAAEMCAECPLLELCGEVAQRARPSWGVWGGRAWGPTRRPN